MNRIISLGGGITSTVWLPLVVKNKYPRDNLICLIAVIKNEHPDVWKQCQFLEEQGFDHTVLRETRDGKKVKITLEELRKRLEQTGNTRYEKEDFKCNACDVF